MAEAQRRVFAREEAWIQDTPVSIFGKECELCVNIADEGTTYEPVGFLRVGVFFTIRLNPICNYDVIWFIIYDIVYFLQSLGSEEFIMLPAVKSAEV